MTDAGERTERVSFRRQTRTQRSDGGYDTTPAVLATVWAMVRPVAARESEQSGRLAGSTTYLVGLEYDALPSDLTTDDSLVWVTGGGAVMNIREIRKPPNHEMSVELVAVVGENE